jgi:hypothetical protein
MRMINFGSFNDSVSTTHVTYLINRKMIIEWVGKNLEVDMVYIKVP